MAEALKKDPSIVQYVEVPVKWVPYKKGGGGRWQCFNGHGWENASASRPIELSIEEQEAP